MRPNGSSRTPFDNDLVTDPGAPKDTQPLPAQSGPSAQPLRPSRLLPPQPGNTPTPMAGATHNAPGSLPNIGSVPPNVPTGVPNDTSRLSLKRTPLSTIIGFSMAGGALAVLLISAFISRAVHRTLTVADHPANGANPSTVTMPPSNPAPIPATGATNPQGTDTTDTSVAMPDNRASATSDNDTAPTVTTKVKKSAHTHKNVSPSQSTPSDQALDDTSPTIQGQDRSAASTDASEDAQDNASSDTAAKPRMAAAPRNDDTNDNDSGAGDSPTSASERFVHSGTGYAVTPPPGFKLVKKGQRTIWSGPDGTTFLVETTNRPGRSPFGDWLRLDASLRKKYGLRYTSRGIEQTTVAGHPAAVWDFDLVTDKGTVRKVDIGIHANGKGYALLGSAPAAQFDQLRPQLDQAIKSFEITQPSGSTRRHRHRHDESSDENQSSDGADTNSSEKSNSSAEDMRPDIGY
ncbi:MAG: hypothetical protein JO316_23485 [Abitibacteriaceae bacterium]|nr:hypothetical protein [Abditibacteriaceae bacterium]MBV9868328.1 hypothetical protein [Abditibacteriaceae bacterium]